MADLTSSSSLILTAIHDKPEFLVTVTLTTDLKLTVTFSDGKSGSIFGENYRPHTGYIIKDKNGTELKFVDSTEYRLPEDIGKTVTLESYTLKSADFPITVSVLCDLCGDANGVLGKTEYMHDASGNNIIWTIYDKRHTCDTKPTNISENSKTTKSITVNVEGWDSIKIGSGGYQPISGKTYTFNNLSPETEYTITAKYTCKNCTLNPVTEYTSSITIKTKKCFTIGNLTLDASAKSIRVKQEWASNGSTGIECSITCNGKTKKTKTSGEYVVFYDNSSHGSIVSGTEYTISISIVDRESNSSTKSDKITTKKATINNIADADITSKIIRVSAKSNYTGDKMELKINSGSWVEKNQDTNHLFNNLTHNTNHNIYCRIKNCFKYNENGTVSSINDSEINTTKNTYLLSLTGAISEEHQHQIITLWQAKVNNANRNKDAIDGTDFTFVTNKIKTKAKKNNPPYQSSEVTEGDDGSMVANYQTDRKIYSNNLTWYYCEYEITGVISDGYNEATAIIITHTTFPYSWIYTNGSWKRIMPYIYTIKPGATTKDWVPTVIHDHNGSIWKESNGE